MSDTKHTPEPWYVRLTDNAVYYIFRYTGKGDEEELIEYFTHDNPGQDARRIVACVNACAGMADPEKEIAALRAAAEKAREALAEFRGSLFFEHNTKASKIKTISALAALEEVLK